MSTLAYQIEPARIKKKITVEEMRSGKYPPGCIVEEKTDDCRYLLQLRPNGAKINYLTSRRISKQTGEYVEKQNWMPILRDWNFGGLTDVVIDGGLYDPKNPRAFASDVIKAMKLGTAHYRAFDLLRVNGVDLTNLSWKERRLRLVSLIKVINETCECPLITASKRIKDAPIDYLNKILKAGGEGIVLKDPSAPYGEGWTKVKRKSTYDVFITGYEAPTSEIYAKKGWFGALKIAQMKYEPGKVFKGKKSISSSAAPIDLGQVKNMTDELRAKISADRKKYIHAVVEISAETRLDSGKFRNPSVIQLRDDRDAESCIFRPNDEA